MDQVTYFQSEDGFWTWKTNILVSDRCFATHEEAIEDYKQQKALCTQASVKW